MYNSRFIKRHAVQLSNRAFSVSHKDNQIQVVSSVSIKSLAPKVSEFISKSAELCTPARVHICDGSDIENESLLQHLQGAGVVKPLTKYENNWLCRTDPADVARVESKTVICTENKRDTVPITGYGVRGVLGKWISPKNMETAYMERFPHCMKGRTMYVIPYSMGPVGSPLSKIGLQLTDSPYVVASMRIMTRMGGNVLETLDTGDFVKGLHSVGVPLPTSRSIVSSWPCNPDKTLIAHIPSDNMIASFGSGYGGNSLLGKKCFALRLGSILARREGWLAEHMLILGITNPQGKKRYIAAAFPSQCGKTNLAMMVPNIPGYKVECVGDDIAWMRFDEDGRLRAINPEAGFFGVAPGTSHFTNPNAMETIQKNTIFTNVAETSDGGYYWEGLEDGEYNPDAAITTWLGEENWKPDSGTKAAHPNSRFCTPAAQCPMMDDDWESPRGVPIDAILFGGRRPKGVPLVYESFNWQHGVFVGASMRSEATAAAEHKGKVIMHDPFAMRPFFGYNFGDYLKHWLSMEHTDPSRKLPKIFHVNWFRKSDKDGGFLWPGFGENARVLDWVIRRCDGEDVASKTAIGYVPKEGTINTEGLGDLDMQELNSIPKEFWTQEVEDIERYFGEQVNQDLPEEIASELNSLRTRVHAMKDS